jgi:hypothetical protein
MKAPSIVCAVSLAVLSCSSTSMQKVDSGGRDVDESSADRVYDETADTEADAGTLDVGPPDVTDGPAPRLCDGEQHLRLWVLIETGGQQAAGSLVRIENGSPVLVIDGTCSYWVGAGWSEDALHADRPVRSGQLSAVDIDAIEGSVPIGDVAAIADCPGSGGPFDYDTREIRTALGTVSCPGTSGARFDTAWKTLQTVANRLWDSGTPMDGAIHVSAFGPASPPPSATSPPAYAWPIALPLSSFVLASSDWSKRGVSRLIDDPDSTRQLRAMRDQYLADRTTQPGLYVNWSGLIATDQITSALVFMRDAVPYEDAQGLLKF